MTSNYTYQWTLAWKLLKSTTKCLTIKRPSANLMHCFDVSQLWLEPILTYNVGTKYYHMQQYFDCAVVLKQDKANFSIVTFWKPPGCDRQKYNLRREVDVWRGCTRYGWWNSRDKQHPFVSCVCIFKYLIKPWKAHARFFSCFLISKPKCTRVEKGYEFLSFVLIMWL